MLDVPDLDVAEFCSVHQGASCGAFPWRLPRPGDRWSESFAKPKQPETLPRKASLDSGLALPSSFSRRGF